MCIENPLGNIHGLSLLFSEEFLYGKYLRFRFLWGVFQRRPLMFLNKVPVHLRSELIYTCLISCNLHRIFRCLKLVEVYLKILKWVLHQRQSWKSPLSVSSLVRIFMHRRHIVLRPPRGVCSDVLTQSQLQTACCTFQTLFRKAILIPALLLLFDILRNSDGNSRNRNSLLILCC